jgi:hypothetical protein
MANDLQNNFSGRRDDVWRMIGKVVARGGLTALIAIPVHGVLALLTKSYVGTFPNSDVFNKIWGREDEVISTHQMSEMPAFYDAPVFGHDKDFASNAGRLSPAQIKEIIAFLETIQEQ